MKSMDGKAQRTTVVASLREAPGSETRAAATCPRFPFMVGRPITTA